MKITLAEKTVAWLTLLSGLSISAVAVYYSVAGLISIFAAAVIPIAVMGVTLELSKLVATVWLKQNWTLAPRFIKSYLLVAVLILMLITSMGIFGYLSKAHSDQSLVSGDVMSKISVYDEKIKTAKDNIDANRKALKQMDEAVDQVMGRSTSETGADKAVAIRRGQQKERSRLQSEIASEQKTITQLNEERAPIAAEVRKVEAEVGPIKYIAAFLYGDDPDTNVLERAVRFVIITIVIVFDPLAVILLLASQYSFQYFKRVEDEAQIEDTPVQVVEVNDAPAKDEDIVDQLPIQESILDKHAYLNTDKSFWDKPDGWVSVPPQVYTPEEPKYEQDDGALTDEQIDQINSMLAENVVHIETELDDDVAESRLEERIASGESYIDGNGNEVSATSKFQIIPELQEELDKEDDPLEQWNKMIAEAEKAIAEQDKPQEAPVIDIAALEQSIQDDAAKVERDRQLIRKLKSNDTDPLDQDVLDAVENLKKKTYMIKDPEGNLQTKSRE